jgi:hypothetical protein
MLSSNIGGFSFRNCKLGDEVCDADFEVGRDAFEGGVAFLFGAGDVSVGLMLLPGPASLRGVALTFA